MVKRAHKNVKKLVDKSDRRLTAAQFASGGVLEWYSPALDPTAAMACQTNAKVLRSESENGKDKTFCKVFSLHEHFSLQDVKVGETSTQTITPRQIWKREGILSIYKELCLDRKLNSLFKRSTLITEQDVPGMDITKKQLSITWGK